MITTKPLKATCVDGDRHRRHGDACLARDRRGRALIFPQNHVMTLRFRDNYALSLFKNSEASCDDLVAAVAEYEDLDRVARRVLGRDNAVTREFRGNMEAARAKLEA